MKHNIVPFVIEDNLKLFYYRGLKGWDHEKGSLIDICRNAAEVTTDAKNHLPTYEKFKIMTLEEKADVWGFKQTQSFDTVHNLVSLFFYDIDHVADANEIMEETQQVYKGMRSNFIKQRT